MKHNTLPSLKVGQVWQCRDQRCIVKVLRKRDYLSARGFQFYETKGTASITGSHMHSFVYSEEVSDSTSYRVYEGDEVTPHDLVQLLYEPNS